MFELDTETRNISMHAGDTGAYKVHAVRSTGDPWTANDRMIFTVLNAAGTVVLQRYYRLDTALGNGYCLIQFHNDDTDEWTPGNYSTERRYVINPRWSGEVPTGDVTNALAVESAIIEGDVVRVPKETGQNIISILRVYGEV